MAGITGEVLREVDRLGEELVELCRGLVRINTVNPYAGTRVTGLEKPGQLLLQPLLEKLGGRTHLFEPPADTFRRLGVLAPKDRAWRDRPNLVTTFDLGPGPRVILNSHMDTVGVDGMPFDPFGAELKDGVIFGRGSSDDKGGMAMGIIAIKAALRFAEALSGTMVHQSVVDEECSGSGAGTLACCLAGYTADEAVVIDGSGLEIVRGCGGCLTADVQVAGRAGHAAHGGVNAIDKAILVKAGIDRFKQEREAVDPQSLVNLGIFHAGVHPAVVPGSARLSLNIVYRNEEAAANQAAGRGWNGAAIRERFASAVGQAGAADAWLRDHPPAVEWVKDLVPFQTPADAPVVTGLTAAFTEALARSPAVGVMPAWADAANLAQYGHIPSVLFGPGRDGAAHAQDETVQVQDLIDGAKVLAVYLCRRLRRNGR